RGSDNDIVIANDPKCSRRHAVIRVTEDGPTLEDLSGKNKIMVDGREVSHAVLSQYSTFILGETEMRFEIAKPKPPPQLQLAPPMLHNQEPLRKKSKQQNNSPMGRIILYGSVAALLYFMLTPSDKKKEDVQLRTDE